MTKTTRSAQTEQKISSFIEDLNNKFSLTEFRPWNSRDLVTKHGVTATITTVLSNLGAISSNHGTVKLNERLYSLRPSTIRKRINDYQTESRTAMKKVKAARKMKIKVASPVTKTDNAFDEIVIALKAKLKQEVMAELLQSLK